MLLGEGGQDGNHFPLLSVVRRAKCRHRNIDFPSPGGIHLKQHK